MRESALVDLIQRLVADDDPYVDMCACWFCYAINPLSTPNPGEPHEPDCPWVEARLLLGLSIEYQ